MIYRHLRIVSGLVRPLVSHSVGRHCLPQFGRLFQRLFQTVRRRPRIARRPPQVFDPLPRFSLVAEVEPLHLIFWRLPPSFPWLASIPVPPRSGLAHFSFPTAALYYWLSPGRARPWQPGPWAQGWPPLPCCSPVARFELQAVRLLRQPLVVPPPDSLACFGSALLRWLVALQFCRLVRPLFWFPAPARYSIVPDGGRRGRSRWMPAGLHRRH